MPGINFYVNPKPKRQNLTLPGIVNAGLSCFWVKDLEWSAILLAILK